MTNSKTGTVAVVGFIYEPGRGLCCNTYKLDEEKLAKLRVAKRGKNRAEAIRLIVGDFAEVTGYEVRFGSARMSWAVDDEAGDNLARFVSSAVVN